MHDKRYLRTLIDWNRWANAETYARVRELPEEEVFKKRPTVLESIHVSLNHLLAVDRMWLGHMQRRPHGVTELRQVLHDDMDALWAARQRMDATLAAYLDGLSAGELEEVVDYELLGGNRGSMSRAMCLTHLVIHGAYHRGWIADMFGQAGALQPTTDLPVYERALRAAGAPPMP